MHRRQFLSAALAWPAASISGIIQTAPGASTPLGLVALGPGALRFLVYLDAVANVSAIEAIEQRPPEGRAYAYSLGERIAGLPIIGPGGAGRLPDLEALASVGADLAVAVTLDEQQVRMLRERVGIRILSLDYGATGRLEPAVFSDSLRQLAQVLGYETRAETLLDAMESSIAELAQRIGNQLPVTAYLGGVSLKGQQGLTSTQAGHPSLDWAGAENLAERTGRTGHLFLDLEQLLAWDPPRLFIDAAGVPAVLSEQAANPGPFRALRAVREGQVYATLPYNAYNTNVEHALINAWFIASILYPDALADVTPVAKADEIHTLFLGQPVYAELARDGLGFMRVDLLNGRGRPW
ncbi:hypothetical protein CKO25_15840 [Thiocapsa imhoffii]|uniref:Fe/B12 periplasmic-binding domain-containing protein n=1 Tax=Thiocapsa imhoffii TaxID=382777 RepID=A0A9X0WJV6_9GAMM|nr:ABC transporter substrate-binding protein [Thiocapsa imhoffii]MBK1646092.1 hypothetical protein [Thiocapsa imhoffii]